MQPFDVLGSTIETAWRAKSYDELAFPSIAARALSEARIHEALCGDDVLRDLLGNDSMPQQEDIDANFGEPPITVYHGRRFQVQVLFWLNGSTAVHDHGFSGAFQVFEGSSVQSRYEFHRRERISSRMWIGDVRVQGAELLSRGDVVEIDEDLIHSVFHLAAPSATIVVRTYDDPDRSPQYEYFPPSLAVDPFHKETLVTRWCQMLELMIRTDHRDYQACAADIIARTDMHTCYEVLKQAHRQIGDLRRVAPLVDAAQQRHGSVALEIAASLRQQRFRHKLFRLRSEVRDPERRFFLAALQNLPDRDSIYALVRRHYPDIEPRRRIIDWVRSLSGTERIGVAFDDDLNGVLFEALLDGYSGADLLERLKAEFDPDEVDAQAGALDRYARRMQETALAPLFRCSSGTGDVFQKEGR
jgi:hypothetical protein